MLKKLINAIWNFVDLIHEARELQRKHLTKFPR